MSSRGAGIETTKYFLLHLYGFSFERSVFSESFQNTDPSLLRLNVKNKITSLLYGLPTNTNNFDRNVISEVIIFIEKRSL